MLQLCQVHPQQQHKGDIQVRNGPPTGETDHRERLSLAATFIPQLLLLQCVCRLRCSVCAVCVHHQLERQLRLQCEHFLVWVLLGVWAHISVMWAPGTSSSPWSATEQIRRAGAWSWSHSLSSYVVMQTDLGSRQQYPFPNLTRGQYPSPSLFNPLQPPIGEIVFKILLLRPPPLRLPRTPFSAFLSSLICMLKPSPS